MNTFKTLKSYNEDIYFRLEVNEKLTVGINLVFQGKEWIWTYVVWMDPTQGGEKIVIEEKKFVFYLQKIELDIHDYFCELIRQIKRHPKYRLKVMNALDPSIREIWEVV